MSLQYKAQSKPNLKRFPELGIFLLLSSMLFTAFASTNNTANAGVQYDILSFMLPASGINSTTINPTNPLNRTCTDSSGGATGCNPRTIKGPMQQSQAVPAATANGTSGSNPDSVYQYTNTFYILKGNGDGGKHYEKFGYDDSKIWLMRDADWAGSNGANANDSATQFPTSSNTTAPYGYSHCTQGFQSGDWCVPDATGANDYWRIPKQSISTGLWANRFMSVGDYATVDATLYGYPVSNTLGVNVPSYANGFNRDYTTGNWSYNTGASYAWLLTTRLCNAGAAGTMNFGTSVGSPAWIEICRVWNYAGFPGSSLEEHYFYALGYGYVRFEQPTTISFTNPPSGSTFTSYSQWGRTSTTELGSVADVSLFSGPNDGAVDSATDHVYVTFAAQTSSKHAQLFFKTSAENNYTPDKSVSLTLNNDGSMKTYDFNFSGNPKWKGTITGLRFDPVDSQGGSGWNGGCGCFRLQSIRVGSEVNSSSTYSANYNFGGSSGNTQGFSTANLGSFTWDSTGWLMAPTGADPQIYRDVFISSGR